MLAASTKPYTPHGTPDTSLARGPVLVRVPRLANDRHLFFVALLRETLQAIGHSAKIIVVDGLTPADMWVKLTEGKIDVLWGSRTRARDRAYLRGDSRITNGVASMRMLMTRKGDEGLFASVNSLAEFRALGKVAGAGASWFEAEVWQCNQLPLYIPSGDWNALFTMIANGSPKVSYITRAPYEAAIDVLKNPDLVIVPRITLIHDRDMRFYTSPKNPGLHTLINRALEQAEQNGLKREIIRQHMLEPLADLKLNRRIRFLLKTPGA